MVSFDTQTSLQDLLELVGLFNATMTYMKDLQEEKNLVADVIQGEFRRDVVNKFDKKDGILITLDIFFNDIEAGNALGPCNI